MRNDIETKMSKRDVEKHTEEIDEKIGDFRGEI